MAVDFVDLHCHSMASLLDGHPDPADIIAKAVELGRSACALTDHGSVSGHIAFERATKGDIFVTMGASKVKLKGESVNIKPIYGLEAYTVADARAREKQYQAKHHLTLLAQNADGYRNLLRLVTRSWDEGFYYRQSIDGQMLVEQGQGLVVLSGCDSGQFMRKLIQGEYEEAKQLARLWRSVFGQNFYIEVQHFPHAAERAQAAWQIAEELNIPTVLTCDSHYLQPDGWKVQQFLWSIRDGRPVDEFAIEFAYMWPPDQLLAFCQRNAPGVRWEQVFENTCAVAASIDKYDLPRAKNVTFPLDGDKIAHMRAQCLARMRSAGKDSPPYMERLEHELAAIAQKGYQDYFLLVADMINWAKQNGIYVGPARGSSAGSLVCWGMRITEIDPLEYGLLFERFIDPTRTDMPDIDVDFEDERRSEVFEYMRRRWGDECVSFISTFSRLSGRSILDDAARSYRIPVPEVARIKQHLIERSSGDSRVEDTLEDTIASVPEAQEVFKRYPALAIAAEAQGCYRQMGQHAAGLIVTSEPIVETVAVYRGKDKQPLIAVDHRDGGYINLMKIDVLGLTELSIARMVCERVGMSIEDLYALPLDDPETLQGFNEHDYLGIFQYGGLATMSVAARVQFSNLREVADVNALSRPGPLHAGATRRYLDGKAAGHFEPILPQPELAPILADTYGQIIYQEQIMRILRDVGDMSWDDVCQIRQIVGKSKGSEAFDNYWPKWLEGTARRGKSEDEARQIWETIKLFGKHGFNLSHAVAYGMVAFWSMYLKRHFPREFYWAQLVKAKDDAETARFINEARRKGIPFASVALSIAAPEWYIDVNGNIAPGWSAIKGIGEAVATELAAHAPYESMEDVEKRVNRRLVHKGVREKIVEALGKLPHELYGLQIWDRINEELPHRVPIAMLWDDTIPMERCFVVGRVMRINKKNRFEELTSKGRPVPEHVLNDSTSDYCVMVVEDETGECRAMISMGKMYQRHFNEIWRSKGKLVAVEGKLVRDIRLVQAQRFWLIEEEEFGAA